MTDGKTPAKGKPQFKGKLSLKTLDSEKAPSELKHAILIHNQTAQALINFDKLYAASRRVREGGDTPFAGEEDLLRAMLLFACSGLDAVVKQLVEDSLHSVLQHDEGAQREFQKFVERRLKKGVVDESDKASFGSAAVDVRLMSELLVSFDPRNALIAIMKRSLCADSLQSRDQLLKVAAHFALTREEVMGAPDVTLQAFKARNQIVHEMDIDLDGGNRRRKRAYDAMIAWCEDIVTISARFISGVETKIKSPTPDFDAAGES